MNAASAASRTVGLLEIMHIYKVIGKFDDIESNSKMNIGMHKHIFKMNFGGK
ncbi:hypothetical protein [Clostridium estertheticum]|uniref:hypothetical protein n=1 Tax=Clostridium estertheticum TaxID=238834 RepID=UPI00129C167B|nr:hypothetical protein [Clostridium estertheticum]